MPKNSKKIIMILTLVFAFFSFRITSESRSDLEFGEPFPQRHYYNQGDNSEQIGGNDFYVGRCDVDKFNHDYYIQVADVVGAFMSSDLVEVELEVEWEYGEILETDYYAFISFRLKDYPDVNILLSAAVLEGNATSSRNFYMSLEPTTMMVSEFKQIQKNPEQLETALNIGMFDIANGAYVEDYTLETDISVLDKDADWYDITYSYMDENRKYSVTSRISFLRGTPPEIEIPSTKTINLEDGDEYDEYENLVLKDAEDELNSNAPELEATITGADQVHEAILLNQSGTFDVEYRVMDYDNNESIAYQKVSVNRDKNKDEEKPEEPEEPEETEEPKEPEVPTDPTAPVIPINPPEPTSPVKPVVPKDPENIKDDKNKKEIKQDEPKVEESPALVETMKDYVIKANNYRVSDRFVKSLSKESIIELADVVAYHEDHPDVILEVDMKGDLDTSFGKSNVEFFIKDNPDVSIVVEQEVYKEEEYFLEIEDAEMSISQFTKSQANNRLDRSLISQMKARAYKVNEDGTKEQLPVKFETMMEHKTNKSRRLKELLFEIIENSMSFNAFVFE